MYILENVPQNEIQTARFNLPEYIMLKFRSKDSNIDEAYNIFQIGLKGKEWTVRFKLKAEFFC